MRNVIWSYLLLLCLTGSVLADSPSRDENIVRLQPYGGISVQGIDTSTLSGKVMCGYQGWFTTPDDGAQKGWTHYSRRGRFEPGHCTIDLWPDVSELEDVEKFATALRHADGSVAYVFSFLNHDEQYGGCTVMLGVPTGWDLIQEIVNIVRGRLSDRSIVSACDTSADMELDVKQSGRELLAGP